MSLQILKFKRLISQPKNCFYSALVTFGLSTGLLLVSTSDSAIGQVYQQNGVPIRQRVPYQSGVPYHAASPSGGIPGTVQIPWYQSLVKDRNTHDFGVVATASLQEHIFEFTNTTGDDLYLNSVRASCGCTKPFILTPVVKAGETGQLKAVFDTKTFYGEKSATLTVPTQKVGTRNGGQFVELGELQFSVKGSIRRDVVFSPGEIGFNHLASTDPVSQKVRVSYAGNPNWKIESTKTSNSNVQVEISEISRDLQAGRVDYDLTVSMNPAQEPGTFNDSLSIITNDPKTSGMSIALRGRIQSVLEAAPIQLGIVHQGTPLTKKWVVRSAHAFKVVQVQTNNPRLHFSPSEGEKAVHILTYTLDTSQTGSVEDEITLFTDATGQEQTKVKFSAQVVPATVVDRETLAP